MGLYVDIFRADSSGDYSNGGPSSKVNRFLVTNVEGPFENRGGEVEATLERGAFSGTCRLVPTDTKGLGACAMFGGNFAYTSDSRFHRAVEEITGNKHSFGPVPIHDRVEY